jgi:predicted secreted protein
MNIAFGIAIYIVIWWLVLFAILPFGVQPQGESEEGAVPGSAESAPAKPHFIPKLIATTLVSGIIFAGVYYVVFAGAYTLDDVPFLPRYERMSE